MKRARFWVWVNDGLVRISLEDGESIERVSGGPNEEGYSVQVDRWFRHGRVIYREWERDARDCDGRFESWGEDECLITQLESRVIEIDGQTVRLPDWRDVSEGQRDHEAERAGY